MLSSIAQHLPGSFHELTSSVSYLLAAITTIRVGWLPRKGSQWLPDDKAVPKVFTIIATPVIAILFSLERHFFGDPLQAAAVTMITSISLVLALIGLFATTYIMKRYGMIVKKRGWFGREVETIKLGGNRLTPEAEKIVSSRNISWATVFQEAEYDFRIVFAQDSVAMIHTVAQIFYLLFEVSGPLALCGAGLLLSGS
jgi:hypothetical protein